jgi:aspartate/methionine/tyrosine aminotransferase
LKIIHENLSLLDLFFASYEDRFEWVRPKAGPIAFPHLVGENVEQFCHQLVNSSGVLLLPGTMYDHPGNHFRLGFARKNMPQALAQLEHFLGERTTTGGLA